MKTQKRSELLLYTVMWVVLFAVPVIGALAGMLSGDEDTFDLETVCHSWLITLPFFAVFLIHNFILAPLLVYSKRRWLYYGLTLLTIAAFAVYWCVDDTNNHGPNEKARTTETARREPPTRNDTGRPDSCAMPEPPMDGDGPMDGPAPHEGGNAQWGTPPPKPEGHPGDGRMEPRQKPHAVANERNLMAFILLICMICGNVYMKYYFRFAEERKRLKDIEKENLEHQLEYLKYQISPHFFMNTLNNIHALVDIDPEMAKTTIVELSKMMRFVLYEGEKASVRVQREIDFTRNYIWLMRLRYADSVKITLEVNEPIPDKGVPPLLTIAFVENAFKHGVSYKNNSFINITFAFTESTMLFTCHNSRNQATDNDHGGVGLENVRRRLKLIYGEAHTLKIKEDAESYNVELTIPLF